MCPDIREDITELNNKNSDQVKPSSNVKASTPEDVSPADEDIVSDQDDNTVYKYIVQEHDPLLIKKNTGALHNKPQSQNEDPTTFNLFDAPGNSDATIVASSASSTILSSAISSSLHAEASIEFLLKERFLMEKILGVGGMGVVYKAKDKLKVEAQDKDPYVAIKILNDEFKSHPEAFISLQRESRKTQRLSHPNIVKVFDFDRDGDIFFMTMEYMEGKPLDKMLKQYSATGLPMEDVWTIIDGMYSALSYAHAEKIVHADFKPGNIFVTTSGMAKIFDFGIARAVTNIDRGDSGAVDRTVFDAGNLGALTPAYASYEMLKGEEPDIRDDIYALGCMTYELLSGKHPFDKIPADEARDKRLRPIKINSISKRQWKAIEKALAFERKDRIETVDLFYHELTNKKKSRFWVFLLFILMVSLTVAGIINMKNTPVAELQPIISEDEIRNEIEVQVRLDFHKQEIKRLLSDLLFSDAWEENVLNQYEALGNLLPANDPWLSAIKRDIYSHYIARINSEIGMTNYDRASTLIKNAYRFSGDVAMLKAAEMKVSDAIKIKRENNILAVPVLPAADKKEIVEQFKQEVEVNKNVDEYNLSLSNVNRQLECRGRLNMRDFSIAVDKLKSLDSDKYLTIKEEIVSSLSSCITEEAKQFPERAIESKKYALRIFEGHPLLLAINVVARDACDESIAGLGGSGKRAVCHDSIKGVGEGPELVVIPAGKNIKSFAIGKYEVSIAEFKHYCDQTGHCLIPVSLDGGMPVTGQSLNTVREYLRWLTEKTGNKYRLPTKDEWIYAASSNNPTQDPNRNCQFSSRGIQKGDGLVKATIGRPNAWGLVNYLGNAQEWVYGKSGQIVAVGGSYLNSMDECQINRWQDHSGQADVATGFRVLRDVVINQ